MEIVSGSLRSIKATFECGGCGKDFVAELDPDGDIASGWDLFEVALDQIRGGFDGGTLQGGYILCRKCSSEIDAVVTEDRNATEAECRAHFGEAEF